VSGSVISPDGDGVADALGVTYRLRRAALVTAEVLDSAGTVVATLFRDQRQSARVQSWLWAGDMVADGRYILVVTATGSDRKPVQARATVVVDRTLGYLSASPPVFSPNGDGKLDTTTFGFDLGASATVTLSVVQYGRPVASVFSGPLQPGPQQFVWNGQGPAGALPDGQYDFVVSAVDAITTVTQSFRFTIDSRAQ
jgi:hypothetical protein